MDSLKTQFIDRNSKARCGLFLRYPIEKQKKMQSALVPLRSCEYDLEIVNSLVNVSLTQTYVNPTEKFLEVDYCFPINPNSCVYKFVALFGNNRIEGIVKEKEEAKKEYNQAIQAGKQAALGELDNESKDIMKLKIGNIAPGQEIRIEISYMQELSLSYNMFYQLHFPGTISPRYLNYIPKEDILKGYKREGFNKPLTVSVQGTFNWTFKISLKTSRKVTFFDSHTHDIQMISQNDPATESIFVLEKACLPNKDFVFSYTTEEYQLPNYVFGRTDHSSSAMLSFIPKFCSMTVNDAYMASVKGTPFEGEIESAKGEQIFLLDRSGSMGGKRIEKAKEALILFIKSLPQDTYFNVVSFGTGSKNLFPASKKYEDKAVTQAVNAVKGMSADMGGTQIYAILERLLTSANLQGGYPKQIFLLTDGSVSRTNDVVKMVERHSKYARVHTIGIGNGASQELIIGCAKSGKGYHTFIDDSEDPSEKIIQLLTDSLSPVISEIKLDYNPNLVQSIIPNPKSIPYILKGEIVNFFITFKGQLEHKANFEFSYIDSHNKMKYQSQIQIDPESGSEAFIDKMAHFKRIRLFQDSYEKKASIEDHMFYVKKVDYKADAIKESVQNQILSQFTAFLCVEKELVDGKYEQIKGKGKVHIAVNNPEPVQYKLYEDQVNKMVGGSRGGRGGYGGVKMMMKCSAPATRSYGERSDRSDRSAGMNMPTSSLSSLANSRPMTNNSSRAFQNMREEPKRQKKCEEKKSKREDRKQLLQYEKYFDEIQEMGRERSKSREREIKKEVQCQMVDEAEEVQFKKMRAKKKQTNKSKAEQMEIEEAVVYPKVQQNKPKINDIIGYQTTEGSWVEISLITKLFGKQVSEIIEKEMNRITVISYLIAKWIEKNHPQKQYALVVKKGLNFVKKVAANHEEFDTLYSKYLQ